MDRSKSLAFEYLHIKLLEWIGPEEENDLSILKSLKLLYLTSNVSTENSLLDTFNNYYAMPLGPVEQDIYLDIKNGNFNYIQINKFCTEFKSNYNLNSASELLSDRLNINIKNNIDISINTLKRINPNLINYTASELVELTHLRSSWIYFFNKARSMGKNSMKISLEFIKSEEKILFL